MRGTTEEEGGVTTFSNVLMLSEDVLISGDGGKDSFGFGFGGEKQNDAELLFPAPSSAYRDSTTSPSRKNNACAVDDKSSRSNKKKRTGLDDGQNRAPDSKPGKRCKQDQKKSSAGNAKIKKEKITALQQLVSPYGKTDTALVLHETMGYIKFLQGQIQVISSPYFNHHSPLDDEDNGDVNPTVAEVRVEKQ